VGQGRVELPTSRLSGVRSNHLSYWPSRPAETGDEKLEQLWTCGWEERDPDKGSAIDGAPDATAGPARRAGRYRSVPQN
jgi:hypothetical protein